MPLYGPGTVDDGTTAVSTRLALMLGQLIDNFLTVGATPADDSVTNAKVADDAAIEQSKIAGLTAAIASLIPLAQRGAANGVATLGADSKIPAAQLPSLAIGETFVVASQAAMLALAAQRGDVAVRTDLNPDGFFLLTSDAPGTLADWVQITAPGSVVSVNGQTGAVDLSGTYVEPPLAADRVQHVSPRGDDANDGLTAKKAKLTVTAALDAIGANPGKVILGQGTTVDNVASWPPQVALDGCGPGISVLKSAAGANAPVIKGKDYDTLTGKVYAAGDSTRGAYEVRISNVTIDGDKANNTSGEGIALWGSRLVLENVVAQNCAGDGIRTEFTTHDGTTSVDDSIESSFVNVKAIQNDGDGWRYRGPHDSIITHFGAVGNGGIGFRNESVVGSYQGGVRGTHWNGWANEVGCFYFGTAVAIVGIDATAANVGVGVEMAPGCGASKLIGLTLAGNDTGMILRGSGHIVSIYGGPNVGDLVQIGSAGVGEGGGLSQIDIVGAGALGGDVINNVQVVNPNNIRCRWSGAIGGALYAGAGSVADTVDMWSSGLGTVLILPGTTVKTGTGYTPTWPSDNGVMVTRGAPETLSNKEIGGGWTFGDGANIPAGTTDGTSIGTAANQKVGVHGSKSVQAPAIAAVAGGATVDAEARTAINALLTMARAKGLIAT